MRCYRLHHRHPIILSSSAPSSWQTPSKLSYPSTHHLAVQGAVTVEVNVAHDAGGQAVRQGRAVVTVFAVAGHFGFGHGTVAVVVPKIRHCGSKQRVVKGAHVVGTVDAVMVGHETYLRSSTGVEVARKLDKSCQESAVE